MKARLPPTIREVGNEFDEKKTLVDSIQLKREAKGSLTFSATGKVAVVGTLFMLLVLLLV